MSQTDLFHYNLTLPEDITGFSVPGTQIRRWDQQALVYDVRVSESSVIRHYQLYDKWFEIRCNLTLDGTFVSAPGPIEWCFHIDICTPCFSFGDNTYHVDLCRHILVGLDGLTHVVIDTDDFDQAIYENWITGEEKTGAENGLADIIQIILNGQFLELLEGICSFRSVSPCLIQLPATQFALHDIPLLEIGERQKHFGIRS